MKRGTAALACTGQSTLPGVSPGQYMRASALVAVGRHRGQLPNLGWLHVGSGGARCCQKRKGVLSNGTMPPWCRRAVHPMPFAQHPVDFFAVLGPKGNSSKKGAKKRVGLVILAAGVSWWRRRVWGNENPRRPGNREIQSTIRKDAPVPRLRLLRQEQQRTIAG